MRTRTVVLILTVVILISFGVSTFSSIISLSNLLEKSSSKEAQLFIEEVEKDITDSFSDSVSISKTINNSFITDFINGRDTYSNEEASLYVGHYLDGLKKQFGYDTAFLVIDCTQEYFTEYGRMKVLDLKGVDDIWYSNFKASNKEMELNVDNDQANENRITVYNNIRMNDENGNFIGACGVGHTLEALNKDIDSLEEKYVLSVALTNKDGIIQVAGDDSLCGTKIDPLFQPYIDNYDFSQKYEYDLFGSGGYFVIKYISEYDWYLCVESPEKTGEMQSIIMKNLVAALIALVIMVLFISVAMKYQEKETMLFKADSETDAMTGLYNRRAFYAMMDEIKNHGTVNDISIVIVDVNGLKQVNDEKGHVAGDELIKGAAQCLVGSFGHYGKVHRTGGDEFIALLKLSSEELEEMKAEFAKATAEYQGVYITGVSVSCGFASRADNPDFSIGELEKIADKGLPLIFFII